MFVKGVDIVKRHSDLSYVSLKEGVKNADIIFCALPLTNKTKGMLNYKILKNINKGALLINIARGEITPLKDLKRLLDEDVLGGIALDVFENESALADVFRNEKRENQNIEENVLTISELKNRDNVLFTPHNAFNTKEALEQKARLSVEAVVEFKKTGKFPKEVVKK